MSNTSTMQETNNTNKKGADSMKNNEIKVTNINEALVVEGFNPDDYKQYYEDGTAYLPFKVQLAWFRMKYPNGKTPVFRPEWSAERETGTYVATARVYKDASDPVDAYLSEASAKRGPGIKVQESDTEIDPYNAVQVAALSMALKMAGFWCSLTVEDLTRELNGKSSDNADDTETSESSTGDNTVEKAPRKRRGRKSAAEKAAEEAAKETKVTAEPETAAETNVAAEPETAVETDVVAEPEAAVETDVAEEPEAAVETDVAAEPEAVVETEVSAEPEAAVETDVAAEPETAVETDVAAEPETAVETDVAAEPETAVETDVAEEPEAAVETDVAAEPETAVETEVAAEPETAVETDVAAEPETAADDVISEDDEKEMAELRAVEFSNGYYNGSIGDLEEKKIEGDELCSNLYNWLLNSSMAKRKNPKQAAAAQRLAELAHADWLKN